MKLNEDAMEHRNSKQRTALLKLLRSTKTHPTAAWLYENLKKDFPDLSMGTVYRNLSILSEQGEILVLRSGSTFDRFDGNPEPHYHIRCEYCGKVEDVDIPVLADIAVKAEEVSGYRITAHRLDIYGICPECQKKIR